MPICNFSILFSGSPGSAGAHGKSEYDADVRRHAAELVAQAIRSTEDKVAEVKRKAGNIIKDLKFISFSIQQPYSNLQKLYEKFTYVSMNMVLFNL